MIKTGLITINEHKSGFAFRYLLKIIFKWHFFCEI